MNQNQYQKFVNFLLENHEVYGPAQDGKIIDVKKINNPAEIILNGKVTLHSFKDLFLPACETLFKYKKNKLTEYFPNYPKVVAFGMTVFDLEARHLFNQTYNKDPYYQKRNSNVLTVGQSLVAEQNFQTSKSYKDNFEENILEHIEFDIFLEKKGKNFRVITGSAQGQKVMDLFGYKEYDHVLFVGPILEAGLDERMVKIRDKMKNRHNQKIWDDLGKICIECGKCTLACPTCYCFRMDDEASLEAECGNRNRCWDSCFYPEFSQVSGGHKFLTSTADRIHFWYYHKFVRIPDRLSIPGCVGCGRCARVCPVGIDIHKVIKSILNS